MLLLLGLTLGCSTEPDDGVGQPCIREQDCGGAALTCRWQQAGEQPGAVSATCVPANPAGAATGSACEQADECRTGICQLGICAELCADEADCGAALHCAEVATYPGGARVLASGCPADFGDPARGKLCLPAQAILARDLGPVADSDAVIVDVPEGAASFSLVIRSAAYAEVGFRALTAPDGRVMFQESDDPFEVLQGDVWGYPDVAVSTLHVPATPDRPWGPGSHCAIVRSEEEGASPTVQALVKMDHGGDVQAGSLDLSFYLVDVAGEGCGASGLSATTAGDHALMTATVDELAEIFGGVGIELGQISFFDRPASAQLDQLSVLEPSSFDDLFTLATDSEGYSVDVFLLKQLLDGAGLAGHMPGPPGVHGLPRSAVAVSVESACYDGLAVAIAHEVSHLLGLFHTIQPEAGFEDPIADTDTGSTNLMYPAPSPGSQALTAGQGYVLRRHPNVMW